MALVTTVDVITPPVNDPFQFGRIAACNALSDVYAMGARPITALQICGFPADVLGQEVLEAILQGSAAAIAEANCVVAGGHTTKDDDAPGTHRWKIDLAPGEEKTIDIAFAVWAPRGKAPHELRQMMQ